MVYAVFLLLLSPLLLHAQAEWEHLPEPYGGNPITLTLLDEGVLVNSEFNGLFLSDDDGRTWEPYGALDGGLVIIGRLGDGALLGVTDDEGGAYRLLDGATSFEEANTGLTGRTLWGAVAESDSVFLMTSDGLFISSDHARSWRRLDLDLGDPEEFLGVGVYGERLVVNSEGRAWYSDDLGSTFREITDSLPESPIGVAFSKVGDLLVGTSGGLYISRDGAESFSLFGLEGEMPLLIGQVAEDLQGNFWVSLVNGHIYRLSADGTSAERIDIPTTYAYFIRVLESGTILISDNGTGIWRSDDGGETFRLSGIPYSSRISQIFIGPDRTLIVPIDFGIATSTDQGDTWVYRHETIETEDGSYEDFSSYRILEDGTVFGIGREGSLVRWYPDGEVDVMSGVFPARVHTLLQVSTDDLIAFVHDSAFRSTDRGDTWQAAEFDANDAVIDGDGAIWYIDDELFSGAWLQRSTDGGETFEPILVPDYSDLSEITRLPEGGVLVTGRIANEWTQSVSFDQGATWTPVELPCPEAWSYTAKDVTNGPGLILQTACGIYYWDRTTHQWNQIPFPTPEDARVYGVAHSGDRLFIATDRGLYRIAEESMSVTDRTPPSPGFSLSVRPTGSSLDLLIRSERAQGIDFELYTVDGRRLLAVPGRHVAVGETRCSIPLPEGLRSGAYILRGKTEGGAPVAVPFDIVR